MLTPNTLNAWQIVYYEDGDRKLFWPADTNREVLAVQLRYAQAQGLNARLAEVLNAA